MAARPATTARARAAAAAVGPLRSRRWARVVEAASPPEEKRGSGLGMGHGAAGVNGVLCGADARANYSVWDVNDGVARPTAKPKSPSC